MSFIAAAELALRSSLLLGAAWLAAAIIRGRGGSAATRHAVWMLGFAAIASLPLLSWLLPPLPLPVLPAEPPALPAAMPVAYGRGLEATPSGPDYAVIFYAAVAAVLLGRLALGRILLERMWRGASPMAEWRTIGARISIPLGISRPVEVRIAAQAIVPMTWGTFRPRILLPIDALGWSADRQRSVLLHELGHVSRHDSLGALIAQAVCALYWVNPLAWFGIRQMRLAQEEACDDLVLDYGTSPTIYARHLLDGAGSLRLAHAALAMSGRTHLERRLRSILAHERRGGRAGKGLLVGGALFAVSIAPVVATVMPAHAERSVPPTFIPAQFVPGVAAAMPAASGGLPPSAARKQIKPSKSDAIRPISAEPAADAKYEAELARYSDELATYGAQIERYNAELATFRAESDEFARKAAAYHQRIAEIGPNPPPGTALPTYPTYPTYPTAPTAPTAPVRPPTH